MKPRKFLCKCGGVGRITYSIENNIRYYLAQCNNCGWANSRTVTDREYLDTPFDLGKRIVEELAASFGGVLLDE